MEVTARCRTCGRRVATADVGCPVHGPVERADGAEADPSQISTIHWPAIPGYRTERVLGRGGFGVVFAAEREADGHEVAIKLARTDRPKAAARLQHERRVLAAIGPPYVPEVHGGGTLDDGSAYIVMERVRAPTLATCLVACAGSMPLARFAVVAPAMVRTLCIVHARGYVHRDLKPENIFIDEEDRARFVDFGLVVPLEEDGHADEPSLVGGVVGTAEYMAPEQCEGSTDIDVRADIYAMGILLYELLAGRPPFWGAPRAVQQSHRGRRPPRLAALTPLPPALEEVVLRCLAKERDERFESAAQLLVALERALAAPKDARGPVTEVAPVSPREPAPMSMRSVSGREQRTVGLLFFESEADAIGLQKKMASLGGELAHAAGRRFAAVFGHDSGENPARRAMLAGQEIIDEGLTDRALVDLAPVAIQTRPSGARRFMSPLFGREGRFPTPTDAAALFLTQSAASVLPDVHGVENARGWTEVGGRAHAGDARMTAVQTRAARLLGRDDVLGRLIDSAHAAIDDGEPVIEGVVADVGHGKSRLCAELVERLQATFGGVEILELRGHETVHGGGESVRDLLQKVLNLPAAAPSDGRREVLSERLGAARAGEVGMAVALALGWVAPDAPELRLLEAAPGALRSALTLAAGEALRRRAAEKPLLVVLDDAHLADDATLSALEYAALAEARAPIWICTLGRLEFETTRPSWGERAKRHGSHKLGPLDAESAALLCRRLLLPAEDVPDSAVQRLVHRSQAIPLLLVELVRGLKRGGLVRRHAKGGGWYVAADEIDQLPDLPLVEWLADREIGALGPGLAAHAHLIALLGDEVTVTEVAGVLRRLDRQGSAADVPLDAKVGIQRLLAAGVLVPRERGYGFRHALVREAVARSTERLRQQIHVAAFEHYRDEALLIPLERRLSRLAFHAEHAGMREVAEDLYLTLAEQAHAQHAYLDAEQLYTRALLQSADGGDPARQSSRVAAYRGRALMRYRLGRYHDSLADFDQATAVARARGDVSAEIDLLLDQATALDWMDDYKASQEIVDRARELMKTVTSPAFEARAMLGEGRSIYRFSRVKEATALLEQAAHKASRLGDEGYETRVIALLLLGFIYPGLGRVDDAVVAVESAIALCEEHGDRLHLVSAVNNRALLSACRGDRDGMTADFTRVLALARELGQGTLELVGQFNLAEYLYLMDAVEEASAQVSRVVEVDRRLSGVEGRAVVALLSARVRLFKGEEAEASAIATRLRVRQAEALASGSPDVLGVPSEEVLCAMIELATRDARPDEWDALEARSTRFSVGQERMEVLEMRGLAALRRGRAGEARGHLERALSLADEIPNVMRDRLVRELGEALAAGERGPA